MGCAAPTWSPRRCNGSDRHHVSEMLPERHEDTNLRTWPGWFMHFTGRLLLKPAFTNSSMLL